MSGGCKDLSRHSHNLRFKITGLAWRFFPRSFLGGSDGKASICLQCRSPGFDPWVGKIPWRRKWQPTPVFSPGKFHGQWSLVCYLPRGRKESDTTEWLHFHSQTKNKKYKTNHQRTGLPPHPALPIRGKRNKHSAQISASRELTQTTASTLEGQKSKGRKNSIRKPGKRRPQTES